MKFRKKKNANGQYYSLILGDNGEPLFKSSEFHPDKRTMEHAIDIVREGAHEATIEADYPEVEE